MEKMTPVEIIDRMEKLFPDARCELVHRNTYEMAVAVILSAQTTDISVNRVTPALFEKYPDIALLAAAEQSDVEGLIASLGLYRNKARSIISFAKGVMDQYGGTIPQTMEELVTLSGVGRKCANVILSECFGIPSLAVDTHVSRVSKRLGLCYKNDTPEVIERKLKKKIPEDRWIRTHHTMIFFGRYMCHARRPACTNCPFKRFCREKEKNLNPVRQSGVV